MCDFDLSQALDGPSEVNETRCEPCCFDMKDVKDEIIRLDEGLDLVVSRNLKTLQGVANLLLAVNRLKKPLKLCSQRPSDDELCSAIMESLVEETVVVDSLVTATAQQKRFFYRVNTVKECTLCDTSQKAVICASRGLQLQAITLKGGHSIHKVSFKLSAYIHNFTNKGDDKVVALSIKNNNLHMSCSMNDNTAVLNLEECSEDHLRNITNDGNLDRFLFRKRDSGRSLTTFESVRCPGWFISTCSERENQPVEMCQQGTACRLTHFKEN